MRFPVRPIAGSALVVASALMVAGCAAGSTPSDGGVTLRIASSIGASDLVVFESMIDAFNESHPGTTVTNTTVDASTLQAELPQLVAAGQAYDLVLTNESTITPFAALGALSPLNQEELTNVDVTADDYLTPLWNLTQYDGSTFGLPFSSTAAVLYSNNKLLDGLGLSVPSNLDEFLAAGRQCTTDGAGLHPGDAGFSASALATYGVGVSTDSWALMGQSLVAQFGGTIENGDDEADFANPAVQSAISLVQSFADEGIAPAPGLSETDFAQFQSGRSCFFISGAWNVQGFQKAGLDFTLSPLPTLGDKPGQWGAGAFVSLPKQPDGYDTGKRKAAVDFAAWMTSEDANLRYVESGNLPSRVDALESTELASLPVGSIRGALEDMYIVGGYPWVSQMNSGFAQAYEAVLSGQPMSSTLQKVTDSTNQEIESARETYIR